MADGEFAILLGRRKRLEGKFKRANATSEDEAVKLEELKLDGIELNIFKRLAERGIILKTQDGRYYWRTEKGSRGNKHQE